MNLYFILFSLIYIIKGVYSRSGNEYSGNEYSGNEYSGNEYSGNEYGSEYYEIIENTNRESILRKELFKYYSREHRPVLNYNDNIEVNFTLNINSLESFDQISEKVKFNMEMNYVWYDEYLKWDRNKYGTEYLNIGSEPIWKPDLELYNSASYPELWSLKGSTKVYSNGKVRWVLPILYEFSCPLKLNNFPFDTQNCQMDFGSWKMNKDFLNIRINPEYVKDKVEDKYLVKYKKFKHNEWTIKNVKYETIDMEYLCCPNELWTITHINIYMKRKFHKYLVVMIMTAFLTISALVVNTLSVENYRRTYILVFIPLSIIWLQLYIASKIPVIEYSTLMERFIISSYTTCIICAIESGIMFCILSNYFNILNSVFKKNNIIRENYNRNKISFIIRNINDGNNNGILFSKLRKILLTFDDFFKIAIIFSYFISIIIIV